MHGAIDLSLAAVQARLADYEPRDPITRVLAPRRASVAVLLRYGDDAAPSVLLMQRAVRAGDKWSGHVSFPGGREEDRDRDLVRTAVRETREEVGLDLDRDARWLGRLDGLNAVGKGKILPMTITPHVFLETRSSALALGPEAAAAFWLPLGRAVSGALDHQHELAVGPARMKFPAWRYQGRVIWGLTFKMLQDLVRVVDGR
ncbi:MAG: CoA pyrophosphatase [Myxococcales bacterium]|nr:CoA pyrophosphatase [Myxococcales bacterium]MCB9755096.1 CoA pyrophosphatase [Myxococcales bacterium]